MIEKMTLAMKRIGVRTFKRNNMLNLSLVMRQFVRYGLCSLFLFGCALQSSLVDLEEKVAKMEKVEEEIPRLRILVDKLAQPPSVNQPKGAAQLLGEINRLKEHLRVLEGRIEEQERKGSRSLQTGDDQSYQVNLLSKRIDLLEQRRTTTDGKPEEKDKEVTPPKVSSEETASPLLSPTEAYNLAYNDYLKGNYDLAIISFQGYIDQYPKSALIPEAIYWIGQSHYNQRAYQDAIRFFEQIGKKYPTHDKIPNAMLKEAFSYIELSNTVRAKEILSKLIAQFPQSNESYRAKDTLAGLSP